MSAGLPIALLAMMDTLSDVWQANMNPNDPYYSTAIFIPVPFSLGDRECEHISAGQEALTNAINAIEGGTYKFASGRHVSYDGKVVFHGHLEGDNAYVRIGFRDEATRAVFLHETRDIFDKVPYHENSTLTRLIGGLEAHA